MSGEDVETSDGAKIRIHYVEEWLKRVEKKIDENNATHTERFRHLEKQMGEIAAAGYVTREKYDAEAKTLALLCEARHSPINVAIDKMRIQQTLWSGNAQIIRWFVMVTGAATIVYLVNRIPWP